jgi:hypothetical protein
MHIKNNARVQYRRLPDEDESGDSWNGMGGMGGGGHHPASSPPELDARLTRRIGPRLTEYSFRWRLLALMFGQPKTKFFDGEVLPKLPYWDQRSSNRLDFMCVGLSQANAFDTALFASSVGWLESRSAWRYSGDTDLVLLNAQVDTSRSRITLATDTVVAVALEQAMADGAFRSVGNFVERIIRFADTYKGDDPTWGFSDAEGQRLGVSGLKALLLSCLPKALRKDAKAAFHLRVREYRAAA